jgi:uncharacterized glyoxalase superfamily protein PhnB
MILRMKNRSVPVDTVIPHLRYKNVLEAFAWLQRVFGFREEFRYGEPVSGMQVSLGGAYVMIGAIRAEPREKPAFGREEHSLTVVLEDVASHYAHSVREGATIVEDLHVYGELQYGVRDCDGYIWLFAQHVRDLAPEDWGAKIPPR